ncbi:MAG: hypothetical protein EOP22_02115 [Hyphomicrobiales bacterium]|nr:MAG: hypothetical protein EOP22_02115 [Hyphomicrobiales bacterium]
MDETQIDVRGIINVLRRQFRLIAGVVFVVLAIATIVVLALKPIYTSSALILVDTSGKDVLDPTSADLGSSTINARVDSEVELAKAPTVLLRVVRDAKLLEDPSFRSEPGWTSRILTFLRLRDETPATGAELLDSTLSQLRSSVSVQRRGLTFLIAIQAQATAPEKAAMIANAVANAYISEQLDAKIDSTLAARDIIQDRLTEASGALALSEDAVDDFITTNIGMIADETGRSDLEAMLGAVTTANDERSRLMVAVDAADLGLRRRDWTALTQSLQSDALLQLETQRQTVADSLARAGEGSQTAIDLRAELSRVEAQLEAAAESELGNLRAQVTTVQGRASDLQAQLRSGVLSSNLSSATLTKIYELQQNSEIARGQYQTLLTRLKELDQQAFLQMADSRIVSEALPPEAPSFPNPRVILAMAGIAALGLGIGLAFLYENFIGGVVSTDQLQSLVKSRRALSIPRQKPQREMQSLADIIVQSPLSVFAEAIRKVRLAVDQSFRRDESASSLDEKRGRVVLVTSTAPGEGKTTTSLALARAYAQSGLTTLLIDCDLRKPSVHRQLGWNPSTGLIDYLSSGDTTEAPSLLSIVKVDESSGIGVLVGSRKSDGATDALIVGQTFGRLVRAATKAFEVVILDTPPVEPVVDGVYLAQFADAVVFVVKWASTPQPSMRTAVASISEAMRPGADLVMVLNQNGTADARYSAKYGYYSDAY